MRGDERPDRRGTGEEGSAYLNSLIETDGRGHFFFAALAVSVSATARM
jgi:hypothetical protein